MPWRPAVTGLPGYQNGIGSWSGFVASGIVREVVVRAVRARDLARRERVADDAEDVLEASLRLRPVAAEPVVLDRRHAAADAEVEPSAVSWSTTHMSSMIRTG